MALAEDHRLDGPGLGFAPAPSVEIDERAARRALREQIARLEADLGDALITAFPHMAIDVSVASAVRGPRLLDLGELERLRDELAERLAGARVRVAELAAEQARKRELLERMLREPRRHKFAQVANRDLGEGGCGVYQVRPRLGIIGMLAGWWHVKLSSGCPLATARRLARRAAERIRPDGQALQTQAG